MDRVLHLPFILNLPLHTLLLSALIVCGKAGDAGDPTPVQIAAARGLSAKLEHRDLHWSKTCVWFSQERRASRLGSLEISSTLRAVALWLLGVYYVNLNTDRVQPEYAHL